jgi:hypothetical protein
MVMFLTGTISPLARPAGALPGHAHADLPTQ